MKKFSSLSTLLKRQILLCLTAGVLIIAGTVSYNQYQSAYQSLTSKAKTTLNLMSKSISDPLWNLNEETMGEFNNALLEDPDIYYYELLDTKGTQLYRSAKDDNKDSFDKVCLSGNYHCESAAVKREGQAIGKMNVAFSLTVIKASIIESLSLMIGLGFGVILFLALLISRIVSKTVRDPLGLLGSGATELAEGNLEFEFKISQDNEIGQLADRFSSMRDSIRAKIADLKLLNELGQKINTISKPDEIYQLIAKASQIKLLAEASAFYNYRKGDRSFALANIYGESASTEFGDSLAADNKEVLRALALRSVLMASYQQKSCAYLPVMDEEGQCYGLLLAPSAIEGEVGEAESSFLETLTRTVAIRLDHIHMVETIEAQNRNLEKTVQIRTKDLARKTNDLTSMLQNVKLGIFTVMPKKLIHSEYSRYMEEIFGSSDIAEENAVKVMFANSGLSTDVLSQLDSALDTILGEDELNYAFNQSLLVNEATLSSPGDKDKHIEIEWNPLINDERVVERVLVTVRDVTEVRALRDQAAIQSQAIELIYQIIRAGSYRFKPFLSYAESGMKEALYLIDKTLERNEDCINSIFRILHTIKGNARTLGYTFLCTQVHNVEHKFSALRSNTALRWNREEILGDLRLVMLELERYKKVFDESVSNKGSSYTENLLARMRPEIERFLNKAQMLKGREDVRLLSKIHASLQGYIDMQLLVEEVKSDAVSLARNLSKEPPDISLVANEHMLSKDDANALKNIFIHLINNSIDHGIESPENRLRNGKPEKGLISIVAIEHDGILNIELFDDGVGVNWERLEKKLQDLHIDFTSLSQLDKARTIFRTAVSTAERVSEVSGRGVGLDAVNEILKLRGGMIDIAIFEGLEGYCDVKFTFTFPLSRRQSLAA